MNHPKLKSVPVVAGDGRVLVYVRPYERVELADPDGSTQELLLLLSAGTRTVGEIAVEIRCRGYSVVDGEVAAAVDALAEMGVLHEADEWSAVPDHVRARHESNLRYYELFSTPERGALDFMPQSLGPGFFSCGAGGAGSGILQSLVGAGVSFVRLVDVDTVEPKNLARQFCYSQVDIGRRKVEAAADWVRAYSPETRVEPLVERIGDQTGSRSWPTMWMSWCVRSTPPMMCSSWSTTPAWTSGFRSSPVGCSNRRCTTGRSSRASRRVGSASSFTVWIRCRAPSPCSLARLC